MANMLRFTRWVSATPRSSQGTPLRVPNAHQPKSGEAKATSEINSRIVVFGVVWVVPLHNPTYLNEGSASLRWLVWYFWRETGRPDDISPSRPLDALW